MLYVANPILIAEALMRPFDAALLLDAAWVALGTAILLAASFAVIWVAYGRSRDAVADVGHFSTMFTNAGFIGIPLAQAVVGADGVFFIAVANTVQTFLIWTYGVWLYSHDRDDIEPKRVLTNPAIIAIALGLICFVSSWQPPQIVLSALNDLGSLNTGLVMLVLGAYLGAVDLGSILRCRASWKASLLRLVAMPLAAVALVRVLLGSAAASLMLVMYEAMPAAVMASLLAQRVGGDGEYAAGVVALSTLLSLFTLPSMLLLAF
ncbi:MAG: AEC family transporter [Atopobiaceae bacterium]